jgi:hypothetical protein
MSRLLLKWALWFLCGTVAAGVSLIVYLMLSDCNNCYPSHK